MEFFRNMYTITELKLLAIASICGTVFAKAIGGFDTQIKMLMLFVVFDYVSGMYAAWKTKQLSSQIGFKGIGKKVTIFAVVAFFYWADLLFNTNTLRYMAICGYGVLESVSIIENADRGGWGWIFPLFVRDKLSQIKAERNIRSDS